jgi:hypothetical protein
MELEFTYTPQDFQEAMKVKWPNSSGRKGMMGFILTLAMIGILIGEIWSGTSSRDWKMNFWLRSDGKWDFDTLVQDYSGAFFALIFLAAWISYFLWSRSHRGMSLWKANPGAQQFWNMTIDEIGIKSVSPHSESFCRWPVFHFWAETENLFVMRLNSKGLLVVPKRAVPLEQMDQLRTCFRERVVGPAKGFPVVAVQKSPGECSNEGSERGTSE